MRLLLATEQRFARDPSGSIWTTGGFQFSFFDRYLEVFDSLTLLARVEDVPSPPPLSLPAISPQIRFAPFPFYQGPWQYIRHRPSIHTAAAAAATNADALLLRLPGAVGAALYRASQHLHKPFAVEVVGDPWDVFAPDAIQLPARPLWRLLFTYQLQRQCRAAAAVSYVTSHTLQRRYPPSPQAFSTHYSSIDLSPLSFCSSPRLFTHSAQRLIAVGSLETPYKGFDTLINALSILNDPSLSLHIIGSGRLLPDLQQLTQSLQLSQQVHFLGALPSSAHVREYLLTSDLFVMPSRTEGLPRALIEAMASALPCLGSSIGGIPELLPPTSLFPPHDPPALARALRAVLDNPPLLSQMSAQNLYAAQPYRSDLLRSRRLSFYQHLASLPSQDPPHARPPRR
jgi:phosphatidylinositol alpha-1,6-mannosyltransferase